MDSDKYLAPPELEPQARAIAEWEAMTGRRFGDCGIAAEHESEKHQPELLKTDPFTATVGGRMTPRGPVVDEHIFSYYGITDPGHMRGGEYGIKVICSCGAVHYLDAGHDDMDMIRLKCNEVDIR